MSKVEITKERCKGCELCITFCKQECLSVGTEINNGGYYVVVFDKEEDCIGCGLCAEMCPDMVIKVYK